MSSDKIVKDSLALRQLAQQLELTQQSRNLTESDVKEAVSQVKGQKRRGRITAILADAATAHWTQRKKLPDALKRLARIAEAHGGTISPKELRQALQLTLPQLIKSARVLDSLPEGLKVGKLTPAQLPADWGDSNMPIFAPEIRGSDGAKSPQLRPANQVLKRAGFPKSQRETVRDWQEWLTTGTSYVIQALFSPEGKKPVGVLAGFMMTGAKGELLPGDEKPIKRKGVEDWQKNWLVVDYCTPLDAEDDAKKSILRDNKVGADILVQFVEDEGSQAGFIELSPDLTKKPGFKLVLKNRGFTRLAEADPEGKEDNQLEVWVYAPEGSPLREKIDRDATSRIDVFAEYVDVWFKDTFSEIKKSSKLYEKAMARKDLMIDRARSDGICRWDQMIVRLADET